MNLKQVLIAYKIKLFETYIGVYLDRETMV